MRVGVLKEVKNHEYRVAVTPARRDDHSLASGLYVHAGEVTDGPVAAAHDLESVPLDKVLG